MNSPWPELQALSDEEYLILLYELSDELYARVREYRAFMTLEYCNEISETLDRIKALVMARPNE
jgi:hypothetical protein